MEPIKAFRGRAVALPIENIDTDQIIPARYLRVTTKEGLAEGLFADWRYLPDGSANPDFILNQPEAVGAQILVAGNNFGCGSSREHAPWAIHGAGFRAVISTYFADIFRNNSLKNGLLPIVVDHETYEQIVSLCAEEPSSEFTVDLANQAVVLPDGRAVRFPIDGFAKHCLLHGVDELGFLLNEDAAIAAFEAHNPVAISTLG